MKMSKLLKMLLAPFMLYADGADGGGAAEPAGDTGGDDGSSVDWGSLNEGVDAGADDDDLGESEAPAPSPAPAASTVEASSPSPAPAPTNEQEPADPNPENKEGEENADPDAQPPVDSDQTQLTPEQIAAQQKQLEEDFAKWEASETERLAQVYSFDEETAQRLQTEPELVLPQVAAKLHLQVVRNSLEAVQRMLPHVIPQLLQQQNVEKSAMDKFYSINPDLKKYHQQVIQAGKMFRKLNPKAGPDEAAKKIGDMVRHALGLAPLQAGSGAPAPAPAPAPRNTPHRPAMPGSGGGVKPPKSAPKGDDLWSAMAADDDD